MGNHFLLNILLAVVMVLLSAQVQISELRLLTGHYNYHLRGAQRLSFVSLLLVVAVLLGACLSQGIHLLELTESVLALFTWRISEWMLARWTPRKIAYSSVYRLMVISALSILFSFLGVFSLLPFVFVGLSFRNSPLGTVHGKPFWLAYHLGCRQVSVKDDRQSPPSAPVYDVTHYGIQPDTGHDVTVQVQQLIDDVGGKGGGVVFFPRGRYLFNQSGGGAFLQLNHSHVTLEGEVDEHGRLVSELVICNPTVRGKKNPWLSPFFITTGEKIQPSNQFWGLDFKHPKSVCMESSSLSDPGSDGRILTAPFATKVVESSPAGSYKLKVEDSGRVGKYVLLGMYNTTADGNLIKELLGVDTLRQEWKTALRAGDECAPSFQWLVEVSRVVDSHTIELVRPLICDCQKKYEPAIFNVDLLKDIHIRNLHLNSRWNGLFHHHGLPLYYSVGQAQEMDYGWNAINVKRTVHSTIENVLISNFTNPLYVQDSREVTVRNVTVNGYDGHQGIKVYCHTCDCLFENIDFYCHYADMMGGEGNAYANVFRNVRYLNPTFNPVDFDFHGFSEGPMGPPAYNVFEQVEGFRYIKGAGAVYMQPACATHNVWRDIDTAGERRGEQLYYAQSYRVRPWYEKMATAAGYTIVMMMKRKKHSFSFAKATFTAKLADIDRMGIPRKKHNMFFPGSHLERINTTASY